MSVFMDTYALIAWINARDIAHQSVKSYLESYSGTIVVTEWVLLEFADALSQAKVRAIAVEAINRIRRLSMFDVVGFTSNYHDTGFELYANRPDKDWSLTDCISFAVMSQRGLTEALTADHHFEQAGFRAIFK
jgi:uncharacterized protein